MTKIVSALVVGMGMVALVAVLFAFPVMWLWNYLMPDLFALKEINLWQALCLNLLCGLLFRGSNSSSSDD